MNALEQHLKDLETALHAQDVRADARSIAELLADDFVEFGVSGTIWTRDALIEALRGETWSRREISDFRLTLLTGDVALVTYRAHRFENGGREAADSLRSSIWKCRDSRWQLVFHQGTRL